MPLVSVRDGRISCLKIEYNVTEHCNYGCDQCSHLSPYMARKESSLAGFRADVAALARVMRVHRFRFVGGEPLLHRELLAHIGAVRESGIASEIQVCTNGALLDRTPDEVLAAIDTLTISWYPDERCDEGTIARAVATCARLGTRVGVLRTDRFRAMQVAAPIADHALVRDIFGTCEIIHDWSCHTFYEGRFYLCSRPLFTGSYLARTGMRAAEDFRELDGVPLHAPRLKERLLEALRSDRPLAACRHCLGTVGKERPWRQLSAAERKRPTPEAAAPESLIDRRRLARRKLARLLPYRALLLRAPGWLTRAVSAALSPSLRDDRFGTGRLRRPGAAPPPPPAP